MNAPDLGDLGSFPTQGAPRLFRKGPPGGSTNPRRRINSPDLVTGGRAAPSAQHAVVASRINHHRSPRHLSSCCRVQNSSRPLLGSSSSPQELLELISGLLSSLLLPWGPVLAQASLLALYFHQYLRLQSVALRELSKTRQQGRTSTLWELIDRSASEPRGQRQDHFEAFSAGVMSVRPQKNRKSFNPFPQPLQVLHEVYSKLRFHWSCVNGLGILAHPTGSVRGHNLASMDKEMVYVTK